MSKHGENIRKRKDGRWEGRFIKGRKSDRTAIWGYIYGHSYTEVKEKLTIKKMEVQQFALNVDNPTFSELSLTWESSIFLGVKSSTAAHYHYTLQHYILPVLGPHRVQTLNESILESSLLEIVAPADKNHKVLGNAMSKECLTLVRRICRYAVHLHIMRPVEIDLKLPTVNSSNTSVLNNIEQKSVCAFVHSSPTPRRLGMLLMMQMGLRIGEVCGLQWGDFDLQNGILSVRRTVKRIYMAPGKTTLVTQAPKTQSSERDIPIPTGILSLLKEEYVGQSKEVWFLSDTDLRPVEPRCYYKSLQGYLKQAQVPVVRPHALRHTFATTCLQAGCNVKTLSELMGHSSPDITLKRYMYNFFDRHPEINGVHMNLNHHGYILPLEIAQNLNLPIRVAFSHNSGNTRANENHTISNFTNRIRKSKLERMSIERMACSNAAGKYIFGETQSFEILENGIDVKKYRFDEKGRKEIRQRYKVSDDMVLLGFVGRLQYQKNPLFMLQVYNEYRRINNKSKLIIIGTGGLEMECRKYVEKNNLANSVIFAGYISNVYRYYSAMDALLLPSRFEGLAVTAVEAQAAGLTVFASDSIAPEHNIASLVNFISISEPATRWANMITSYTGDRFAKNEEVKNAGYDIQDVAKKLENYYIDLYKKME